jgi:uncharacterized membrane protein
MRTIQHPFRWLFAAVLLGLAVQPILLPHPGWVQAVVGGAAGAQGYALAALGSRLARRLPGRPRITAPHPAVTAALGSATLLTATLTGHAGQVAAATRTRMPVPTLMADSLAVAGAVGLALLLIGLALGLRAAFRLSVHGLRRRVAALVLAPALVLTGSTTAAAAPPRPVSAAVGIKGQQFLAGRPTAADIRAVTGRAALAPIRVYVGRDAAASPAVRAELAVRELERAGGFDRAALLIDVPTGSGWVNPAAGSALEYLYGGDVATVVVQYAAAPSWLAYLRGGEGVQASTRALTDALRARLDRIPAGRRPRLLAYGESLGAWGGLRAYPGDHAQGLGMGRRTDGALWAGIPGDRPGPAPSDTRTLVHRDDPVPGWSLPLMLHGSSAWPARWWPMVSFWQATGDVVAATGVPPGFGHRYGSELVDAWRPLISTAGVPTAAPPDRLGAVRQAVASVRTGG